MKKVDIYTSSSCGYCHEAKEFFEENNIPYTEYNISHDLEARKVLMKKGYRSVPLIVIDGEDILGFEKNEIEAKLGI